MAKGRRNLQLPDTLNKRINIIFKLYNVSVLADFHSYFFVVLAYRGILCLCFRVCLVTCVFDFCVYPLF